MVQTIQTIRSFTPSDIPLITQIESHVHSHPWTEGMFRDCFINSSDHSYEGFIFEVNNSLCAYLIIQNILDECHILTIGVKKEEQNKGYATQLLQYLIKKQQDKHAQRILLEVRESNKPAIFLYLQLGFQQIAVRKNYYWTHTISENALIFEKLL